MIILLENCEVCSELLGNELPTVIMLLENWEVRSELLGNELPTVIMLLENCEVCSEGVRRVPEVTHGTTLFSLELGDWMRVPLRDFRYRSVSTRGIRPRYSSSDAIETSEGRTDDGCDGGVAGEVLFASIISSCDILQIKLCRRLNFFSADNL